MARMFCLVLLLAASAHRLPPAEAAAVTYTIATYWDGQPIEDHDPATVTLDVDQDGLLLVTASAPFFNSPIPPEELFVNGRQQCPQRPVGNLYSYEVVEAFFLNDDDEYLELEFSPQGYYLFIILNGYRNTVLTTLPLMPEGAAASNPCAGSTAVCTSRWSASAAIPRDYLPLGVTRWNAYAIHGEPWGTAAPQDVFYESLFPADPAEVPAPDFHYLEGFGAIDLEADVGYVQSEERSQLWQQALGQQDYSFSYDLTLKDDCEPTPPSYVASASTSKRSQDGVVAVSFLMQGGREYHGFVPGGLTSSGPNAALDTTSESFWVSLSDASGAQTRCGVNPYGAHRAYRALPDGATEELGDVLQGVECRAEESPGDGFGVTAWDCSLDLPATLVPDPDRLQMIHAHVTVAAGEGDAPFAAALCPGFPADVQAGFDWAGCEVDPQSLV